VAQERQSTRRLRDGASLRRKNAAGHGVSVSFRARPAPLPPPRWAQHWAADGGGPKRVQAASWKHGRHSAVAREAAALARRVDASVPQYIRGPRQTPWSPERLARFWDDILEWRLMARGHIGNSER
jgi:hypothetical protein